MVTSGRIRYFLTKHNATSCAYCTQQFSTFYVIYLKGNIYYRKAQKSQGFITYNCVCAGKLVLLIYVLSENDRKKKDKLHATD